MNIPGLSKTEVAGLAGIKIPKDLTRKTTEAQAKLDRLLSEVGKLKKQIDATDIPALRKQAALSVADGKDATERQAGIASVEQSLKESRAMLAELEALVPAAEADLEAARGEVERHVNAQLVEDHNEMTQQLEAATNERARNIGSSSDGRYSSSAPKKQSRSRISICEGCRQPIATFDKKISQPITGASFQPLGGLGVPFKSACEFLWLRCPRCGKFPWREEDKILTSAGFFSVPADDRGGLGPGGGFGVGGFGADGDSGTGAGMGGDGRGQGGSRGGGRGDSGGGYR